MTDIPWKTTPFDHQRTDVERFGQAGAWARFWEPGCVDADTEYLSPDGWRRIADYTSGPVAQFDPNSETASFVEPLRYIVEDCPEFIQLLSDRGLNQRLSPDHRVLRMTKHGGAYKWTTAAALAGGENLPVLTETPEEGQVQVKRLMVMAANISRVPSVDGKAYCFQVPTGALVLRREGNVFITGNCGKTLPTLAEAAWLYELGEIDGVIVLAPNGVHRNWAVDQVPQHLGVENYKVHTWQTSKVSTRWHSDAFADLLKHDGLALLFMSYDAVKTEKGSAAWRSFLKLRRCLYVLDESPRIKSPTAQVTKKVLGSRDAAPYRRILTGTPVDDKPFDIYTQIKFLNPEVWNQIGCRNYTTFKNQFGIWVNMERRDTGHRFKKLVEYRNMDLLQEQMRKVGSRIMKEDVLDLPPKLYSTRYFEMSPQQRKVYAELRDNMITFLDSGDMVSADLAITKILRLQQVTSGWLPTDEDTVVMTPIGDSNPRLKLLGEIIEDTDHQMIVWAKYRQDVTNIMDLCHRMDVTAVRYDGTCSDDQMARSIDTFKAGNAKVFVANPKKASEGITLTCAKTMVYYNQNWRLAERLQSEDRIHRIGQDVPVHIIDLCAQDTVDRAIIEALKGKRDMAALIQGDEIKDWIK